MIAAPIVQRCSEVLGKSIKKVTRLSGGDINEAYLLQCPEEDQYFLKFNTSEQASAVKGLNILSKFVSTPQVIYFNPDEAIAFLLLEYIEPQAPTTKFWENFGQTLAHLHQQHQAQFGLDHHNFIGSLSQNNHLQNSWAEFYIKERLQVQLDLALASRALPYSYQGYFDRLYPQISHLCPKELPTLIHGDLWSGNFMVGIQNQVILIDPSVAYAQAFPAEAGLEDRLPIYQLYYLMVHVNIFGGSYVGSVKRILDRFI